jgi:hypothetical protein
MHETNESVIIKNTFIYEIIKRDSSNNEKEMDEFYLKTDKSNNRAMEIRVFSYLENDMVS